MSENPEGGDKSSSKKGTLITAISGIALIAASAAQISGNLKPVWEFLGVSNSKAPGEAAVPASDEGTLSEEADAEEGASAEEIEAAARAAEKNLADLEPAYSAADTVSSKFTIKNPCNRTMQVKLIYETPDGQIYTPAPDDYRELEAGADVFYEGLGGNDAATKRSFVLVRATTKDGTAYMAGDFSFTIGGQAESYTSAELKTDDDINWYFDLTCPT